MKYGIVFFCILVLLFIRCKFYTTNVINVSVFQAKLIILHSSSKPGDINSRSGCAMMPANIELTTITTIISYI